MTFYLRTKSYTITEDGFMHNHQDALDSQREEDAINDLKISGNPLKFSFMDINSSVKKSPDLNENKLEILKKIN